MVGWKVVLGLTARLDSTCISVYIEPTPKEKEKEKKNHRGEKNVQTTPDCPFLVLDLRFPGVAGRSGQNHETALTMSLCTPTASTIGPCHPFIQISRTLQH